MKKIIALLLAAVMLVGLVACVYKKVPRPVQQRRRLRRGNLALNQFLTVSRFSCNI